ncbi:hypothetical protein ABZS88_07015 [Streptomyces sp. NPDC005480]|uniref:hypothetical protein n=1 Tax=Streptomyces sp. NPDC005480 TaxID=3154880 RepID=UPI0033ABA063
MENGEPSSSSRKNKRRLPEINSASRRIATAAAGGTLVIWWPAFTFGAYNAIFFDNVMALWAVATAVLLSGLVSDRRAAVPWSNRIALLLPTLWIVVGMVAPTGSSFHYIHYFEVVITVVSAPYLTWLLTKILLSDYDELPAVRRFEAVGITVAIGVLAFLLGKFNYLFLTCADFNESGNNTPPGCAQGPPFRLR